MNIVQTAHTMNIESSHDTAMNIMYILMGIMFIFDIAMLYAHVAMHRKVKVLEAELASRK
jgi:hypothetical protein